MLASMSRLFPLWLAVVLGLAGRPVFAQGTPMAITTDTVEYCFHLFDQVSDLLHAARTPTPREVTDLTTEGQRMCDHGQTRGGIIRLRRALMLIRQTEP